MLRGDLDVIIRRAGLWNNGALACVLIPGKRILASHDHAQEQAAYQAKDEVVFHSVEPNYIIELKWPPNARTNAGRIWMQPSIPAHYIRAISAQVE